MNLLPPALKAQLRREYRLRFTALFSIFVFFALFTGIVTGAPFGIAFLQDYLLSRQQSTKVNNYEPSDEDKQMLADFQSLKNTLTALDPKRIEDPVLFSELIKVVLAEKPTQIRLQGFSLVSKSDSQKQLQISGVASTRESLVTFSKRLSVNTLFSGVDLPISNLSRKEDIEFSITAVAGKEESKEKQATE
ncbi:MAG TPA: PilN domain-containing protein [Candidatus Paceibacterota bacterium]